VTQRSVPSPSDLDEVRRMHAKFVGVLSEGAAAVPHSA